MKLENGKLVIEYSLSKTSRLFLAFILLFTYPILGYLLYSRRFYRWFFLFLGFWGSIGYFYWIGCQVSTFISYLPFVEMSCWSGSFLWVIILKAFSFLLPGFKFIDIFVNIPFYCFLIINWLIWQDFFRIMRGKFYDGRKQLVWYWKK